MCKPQIWVEKNEDLGVLLMLFCTMISKIVCQAKKKKKKKNLGDLLFLWFLKTGKSKKAFDGMKLWKKKEAKTIFFLLKG